MAVTSRVRALAAESRAARFPPAQIDVTAIPPLTDRAAMPTGSTSLPTGETNLVLVNLHRGDQDLVLRAQVRIDLVVIWQDDRTLAVFHRDELAFWLHSTQASRRPIVLEWPVDDLLLSRQVLAHSIRYHITIDARRTYHVTPTSLAALNQLLTDPRDSHDAESRPSR